MIGACGISAFPMSARVVYKMAIKEDPQNYLLMQCVGVNVSGQVASVIAGGLLLNLLVLGGKTMNFEAFLQTLPIMGKGMAGIFLVTGVIVLCILILGKAGNKPEK